MCVRYLFPLVALSLLASACGGDEPQPTAVPATATAPIASQAAPTTAPAYGQQPTAIPVQKQPAVAPTTDSGQEQTAKPKLDLDATPATLKSYRIRFTLSFEGKLLDGKALKGSAEFIQEAIAETKEQRIRFANTRQDEKKDEDKAAVDRFILGDVNYYYIAEGNDKGRCISLSLDAPTTPQLAIFTPSDFIGNPQNPRLVEKGVTINGIKTDRYIIEESNLKGEAWIAQEGNFFVKYTGELTGKVALFDSADGVAKWEYQLEADAVSKIELPEACVAQKLVDNVPLPASAADKYQLGGVVSFRSSESPQKVADFYKAEMPKLGWTQGEASEAGDLFLLEFKKDARTVSITINKEDAGSGVVITEKKD